MTNVYIVFSVYSVYVRYSLAYFLVKRLYQIQSNEITIFLAGSCV